MIKSLPNLYSFLHLTKSELNVIVNSTGNLYYSKNSPKKKYGEFQRDVQGHIKCRDLLIPCYPLKKIQKRINDLLHSIELPDYMYGSIRGKNHIMNALQHLEQEYFLTTDLKNFFPNINHHQVFHMFCNNGFSPSVSRILTKLTTYNKSLPQGATSSPVIANLVFVDTAQQLALLSEKHNIIFTAFLDDLSFSSKYCFKYLVSQILHMLKENSFHPSYSKIHYRRYRCEITGLIVR